MQVLLHRFSMTIGFQRAQELWSHCTVRGRTRWLVRTFEVEQSTRIRGEGQISAFHVNGDTRST